MINIRRFIVAMCICSFIIGCGKDKNMDKVVSIDKPEISGQDRVQIKNSHLAKAQEYISDKRYEDAVIELNEVTKLDSKDPAAYYTLGNVYEMMGKNKESVKAFITAIKLDPYAKRQMSSESTGSMSVPNLIEPCLATDTSTGRSCQQAE
ncbi:tetratricopeptide repeat protein [Candidatus Desantisbacteria bacterium]|nr:tetratricopeptide repeat protein [Candidatus Desantisbacteria bacterium]